MTGSDASSRLKATIAQNIRDARKASGMTQVELAIALGGRDSMLVSRWERGENAPSRDNLVQLAQILGVTVADFYDERAAA